jgi:hypothetical protein
MRYVKKCGRIGRVTDDSIMWRMRFVCWITKGKKRALRMCNTYCFCTARWLSERALILHLYVHRLCETYVVTKCLYCIKEKMNTDCWWTVSDKRKRKSQRIACRCA